MLGTIISDVVGRLMSSQIAGTFKPGWAAYAGAALVFAVVSLVAITVPARRAMRLDAVDALRTQ